MGCLVLVLASTSKTSLLAAMLGAAGLGFVWLVRRGPLSGVAATWVRTTVPDAMSFIIELGPTLVPLPKLISFVVAIVLCLALGLFIQRTDTGRQRRAGA